MHGLIFFYIRKFAESLPNGLAQAAGQASGRTSIMRQAGNYLPSGSYPDDDAVALLQAVADEPDPGPERIAAARTEAHKLHGLLGTIGLPAGSDLAAEIEARLDAGDAGVGEPVAKLRALVTDHA